jgi:RNA polymerase sigma-70 factor, ECF subfamily
MDRDSRLVQRAVGRAKSGDTAGIHFLYFRFAGEVQRSVAGIVGDHHEAEDITHNVFAKLMETIGRYEQQEALFASWLSRVARNAAIDHLRGKRPVPTADLGNEDAVDPLSPVGRGPVLAIALRQVPEDQRQVLVLRHIVGLSPPEIADMLGKTESSINGLHNRGRSTLKANLTALGAAPAVSAGRDADTRAT